MKKHYLFLVFCCMAASLLAQSPTIFDLHKQLLQSQGKLTPDLLLAEIANFNEQAKQAPPPLEISYNLTDSIYDYYWNGFFNDWTATRKTLLENDCAIGKPLVRLEQLDDFQSGNFTNNRKTVYQYFEDGYAQETQTYFWKVGEQAWELNEFSKYVRPDDLEESWTKIWDDNSNSFSSGTRALYSYNTDNSLNRIDAFYWEVDAWVPNYRTSYTYVDGLNTERLGETYDALTDTWTPSEKVTSTYDANDNVLTQTTEADYGGGFVVKQLVTYSYNATNQLSEILYQDNRGNGLENSNKTIYYHHSTGYVESFEGFLWWPSEEEWVPYVKFNFREDGNIASLWYKASFSFEFNGQFDYGYQNVYSYSAEGLIEQYILDEYNPQGPEEWLPFQKTTYAYDGNDQLVEDIQQTWDETEMTYLNSGRIYYFNTGCLFSEVGEAPQLLPYDHCFHANPLRPGQAIQCNDLPQTDESLTLSLYTMAGQRLHQQAFLPGGSFQPSQPLVQGIYLLDIRTGSGDRVHRAKVVVME